MRVIPLLSRKHADAKSKINYFPTICSSIAVGRAVSSPQSYRVFMFQFKCRFHPSTQLPVYFCFMFVSAARNISVWRTRPRSDIIFPILLVGLELCYTMRHDCTEFSFIGLCSTMEHARNASMWCVRINHWIEKYLSYRCGPHPLHLYCFEQISKTVTANESFVWHFNLIHRNFVSTPTPSNFDLFFDHRAINPTIVQYQQLRIKKKRENSLLFFQISLVSQGTPFLVV